MEPSKKLSLKSQSYLREPLSTAGEEREACIKCGLCKKKGETFRYPRIPDDYTKAFLLVTDGHLSGAARRITKSMWREAGYKDNDVAIVPAVRCDPGEDGASMEQIKMCRPFLLQIIYKLQPKNVLALGGEALRAVQNKASDDNLTRKRGKLVEFPLTVPETKRKTKNEIHN